MSTFTTFTKRLAVRLATQRNPKAVRKSAVFVSRIVQQEFDNAQNAGFNGYGLVHLAGGCDVPKSRKGLELYIETAISALNSYK